MRKYTFVLAALAALLFVGASTANAQVLSHGRNRSNVGVSIYSGTFGSGIDINIGGRRGGAHIGIHNGYPRNGGWHRGPVYRGPIYRGPVHRGPVYVPGPIYRDPCGYNYGCGGYSQPSTISVQVPVTYVDGYGRVIRTYRYVTAWYDPAYGGYVYRDGYGRIILVR